MQAGFLYGYSLFEKLKYVTIVYLFLFIYAFFRIN